MIKTNNYQSGQTLLVILLIMAVSLTIGLSIVSSSITDISLSGKSDDSARAFSAAEAGIEEGLIGSSTGNVMTLETGASYQTQTTNLGVGSTAFAFPGEYSTDSIQTFWFADYVPATGVWTKTYDRTKIRFVWGNKNSADTPALEVLIYYKDGSDYKIGRFALDPDPSIRPPVSGSNCASGTNCFCQPNLTNCPASVSLFTTAGEIVDSKDFQNGATIDLAAAGLQGGTKILLFARLKLFYSTNAHILGVAAAGTGASTFPAQGSIVTAVGQSGSATRKVQVKRMLPAPPSLLDYTIYSGGGLIHQ